MSSTIDWVSSLLLRRSDQNSDDSLYGYIPTLYVCALFVALFGLSTLIHLGQTLRYRLWWLLPTVVLAGLLEALGWTGRLWSSKNPGLLTPFLMGIVATLIAPTPLAAANFVILGKIIGRLGSRYSRLSPRWYTTVFCTCDVLSLVIQSVGGAAASIAFNNGKSATGGGNIMLAGIILQMVAITVYVLFAGEFFLRYFNDNPVRGKLAGNEAKGPSALMDKHMKIMIYGLIFNTTCLFIRAVYRTIELADGWNGRILATQVYFNVLDGGMITLAIATLNLIHPGRLLYGSPNDVASDYPLEKCTASGVA